MQRKNTIRQRRENADNMVDNAAILQDKEIKKKKDTASNVGLCDYRNIALGDFVYIRKHRDS